VPLERLQHFPAVLGGHHHVQDDDVGPLLHGCRDEVVGHFCVGDAVHAVFEVPLEEPPEVEVVVD